MNNRWRKAQKAEAAFAGYKKLHSQELTDRVRRQNLEHMCKYTSLSEQELKDRRILEIGGQVTEIAFSDRTVSPKIIIDPLFPFKRRLGPDDKCCDRLRGVGEYLPLPNRSIDLCWCTNVIDHTSSPLVVLEEIQRVLDDQGILIISCNLFPTYMKPFFPLFNIFDRPHPHHFSVVGFRTLLERYFRIQKEFTVDSAFRVSLAHNLKTNIAAVIGARYIYFRCTLNG